MNAPRQPDHDAVAASPDRAFVPGVCWPIRPAALAALVDLGLSDQRIAAYFAVDERDVSALRRRYDGHG